MTIKELENKFGDFRHEVYSKVDSIVYRVVTSRDVWYFILATLVFTFIGIVSVLAYLWFGG